ncbi:MAG: AMP-binding protein [Actinomycetota bacterium]|nr:AMP-binding protein [Actinomycetota bacterium]
MPRLIAIIAPQSQKLADRVRRAWDQGDAVSVLDPGVPRSYLSTLIEALDPDLVEETQAGSARHRRHELPEGTALVITTSGTSGPPKAVVHTHAAMRASALATGERLGVARGDGQWLCALPLTHIGGFSSITKAMHQGLELRIFERFDREAVESAARRRRSYIPVVRANLAQMDAALFERIVLGAGVPPAEIPPNAHVTYGLTETGSGLVYDGTPLPGAEIAIAEDGEILLRGPMLACCYRDGSPLLGADGWFHTDDAGAYLDGRLQVFGRRGDVINSGGERILPQQVEAIIERLPGVAEVAVVGVRDERLGQAAWAVVVPKPGSDAPSLEAIKEAVRAELPHYCAPRGMQVAASLPKTPLGKIQKRLLREELSR